MVFGSFPSSHFICMILVYHRQRLERDGRDQREEGWERRWRGCRGRGRELGEREGERERER